MTWKLATLYTSLGAATALCARLAIAAPAATSAVELSRLERQVRHELVMLPYYSVFDNVAFQVVGNKVTLTGQVTRPTLKKSAERVLERIEGISSVDNQIEVLPPSPNDDRIRRGVYRAIYQHPNFTRYAMRSVPPIHIIVKNGDVTLMGVVATKTDSDMANIQANGVSGVFSVTNDLQLESR